MPNGNSKQLLSEDLSLQRCYKQDTTEAQLNLVRVVPDDGREAEARCLLKVPSNPKYYMIRFSCKNHVVHYL